MMLHYVMVGIALGASTSLLLAIFAKWDRHFEFIKATRVELDDIPNFVHLLNLMKSLFVPHLVLYIFSPFFFRDPATKRPDLSQRAWRAVVWVWASVGVIIVCGLIDSYTFKK